MPGPQVGVSDRFLGLAGSSYEVFDSFLFDCRGYEVVRGAIESAAIEGANSAIDQLDVWTRASVGMDGASRGDWTETADDIVRYRCVIAPGHIQVGPVAGWPTALSSLITSPAVKSVLTMLFPGGHYVDHASLSLAHPGTPGIELHGGGHERDLRQGYRMVGGGWDIGLVVLIVSLVHSGVGDGGTAFVPGSHKANFAPSGTLPKPEKFAETDWIRGAALEPGDLVVFPEALMHGAFPWRSAWERRSLIIKAYPAHIANLNSRMRSNVEPFWRGARL